MAQIRLPDDVYRLEEINISESLACQLAGKTVPVEVSPEELPGTRQVEITDSPALIARDGTVWNDYRPKRVRFQDETGRTWNLTRHWQDSAKILAPNAETAVQVYHDASFVEILHLPSFWDLLAVNIPSGEAEAASGRPARVLVHLQPNQITKVYWRASTGDIWRIPHDWRRRRIRLPSAEVLSSHGVPEEVAQAFSETQVSVNYHTGSLCCLKDAYRFRDDAGNRWQVKMRDCTVLGFGDGGAGSI